MQPENTYLITYDIADSSRWRSVFKIMNGYGEWLQLSVFQCRLTKARFVELQARLTEVIHAREDHVLMVNVGPADSVQTKVHSLGKERFEPIERSVLVI